MIGILNIQSGRNSCLETPLRALSVVGMDIGCLQETRLTNNVYARFLSEYHVLATNAGVALVYRYFFYWQVVSQREQDIVSHQHNVILVGDLNLHLNFPESEIDMEIVQLLADTSLCVMHHHFNEGFRRRLLF